MRYWILLPLLLVACDKEKPQETPAPAASEKARPDKKGPKLGLLSDPGEPPTRGGPPSSPPGAGGAKAAGDGLVNTVDKGSEPRREFRYAFKTGETETFTYELRMTITGEAGQGKTTKDQKVPGIRYELTATTKEVSADGTGLIEWSLDKVDVLSEPGPTAKDVAAEREAWEQLKGTLGKSVISPRGLTIVAEFGSKDQTRAQMLETLRGPLTDIIVPLPEEAVGKGANWTYRRKPTNREIANLVQEESFTLADVTATGGKVARQYSELAPVQEIGAGQIPGGKISLDVFKSTSTSTSVFDLSKFVPKSEASLTMEKLVTATTADGQKATVMKANVKSTAKFAPVTPKKK